MPPGPRPTPTALKLLNGNPGKRALPKNEPKPDLIENPEELLCPDYLVGDSKNAWNELLPVLIKMRVMSRADTTMLENLCLQIGIWRDATRKLATTSVLLADKKTKRIMGNPLIPIINRATALISKLCAEFGLTASSRSRIIASGGADSPADKWDEFAS